MEVNTKNSSSTFTKFVLSVAIPVSTDTESGLYTCNPLVIDFIKSLYKDIAPACSIAPSIIWPTLKEVCLSKTIKPKDMEDVGRYAPLINSIFMYAGKLNSSSFAYKLFLAVIKEILNKAVNCYRTTNPR
jgi:hypothetical protein